MGLDGVITLLTKQNEKKFSAPTKGNK